METLEGLRRRIESAEDMHSIVRTMKTLAAVHIREYEAAVESLDEYVRTVELGLRIALTTDAEQLGLPTGTESADVPTGFVVFGSGHGMCGRFNEQVADFAAGRIGELSGPAHRICALGEAVRDQLRARGRHVDRTHQLPGAVEGVTPCVRRLLEVVDAWREEGVGRVYLAYHRQESSTRSEPRLRTLYPLDADWLRSIREEPWPGPTLPTFRLERPRLMGALAREYFFVVLYRAFAYSLASEHAARLASMQTAEERVRRRRDELLGRYHRERQRKVTEEVLDIMGGMLALEEPP